MLRELLQALGSQVSDGAHPHGAGFMLHGGYEFKCEGVRTVDPNTGITNVSDQHVIGVLSGGPDDIFPIPTFYPEDPDHPGSNQEVNDSIFTLDPSQPKDFDPIKGICGICGKPIPLK